MVKIKKTKITRTDTRKCPAKRFVTGDLSARNESKYNVSRKSTGNTRDHGVSSKKSRKPRQKQEAHLQEKHTSLRGQSDIPELCKGNPVANDNSGYKTKERHGAYWAIYNMARLRRL